MAPGGRKTFQTGGGLRPPPFWKVLRPPGAAQTPKIDDLRSVKKSYIKNLGVDVLESVEEDMVSDRIIMWLDYMEAFARSLCRHEDGVFSASGGCGWPDGHFGPTSAAWGSTLV